MGKQKESIVLPSSKYFDSLDALGSPTAVVSLLVSLYNEADRVSLNFTTQMANSSHNHPRDLLLSPHLEFEQVVAILTPYGFQEIKRADTNLQLIADEPRARKSLSEIIDELLDCLSRSPDPDQALNYLERFVRATYSKIQLFSYLKDSPYTLWLLSKLFGSSPFLSEILIRNPTYLTWIANPQTLETEKSKPALKREFSKALASFKTKERKLEMLCLFKRKELLRIGVRDLLHKSSVQQSTLSLSILAEVIIQSVYEICESSLRRKYGIPLHRNTKGNRHQIPFTIIGMGKLGGGELNFSSDVDILYLYESAAGRTSGETSRGRDTQIRNTEYFTRLSQDITASLSEMTNQGTLYRVDLRLRPEGRSGQLAYPIKGYLQYYALRGETWERLALLKAWPVAGDYALGLNFIKKISRFIFKTNFSTRNLAEVRDVKERINKKISAKGELELNVKLGSGGIREIEFIVQSLQIFFGGENPDIRERNTLEALKKLKEHKLINPEVFDQLTDSYLFLRNVEHSLQMVHELQTHRLPEDSRDLMICALRLDYRGEEGIAATEQFLKEYRHHTNQVNGIFKLLFQSPDKSPMLQAALKTAHHTFSNRRRKN